MLKYRVAYSEIVANAVLPSMPVLPYFLHGKMVRVFVYDAFSFTKNLPLVV